MGKRWCISGAFFLVSFLNFSNSLYVDSLNSGSGNETDLSKWDNEGDPTDFNQELSWKDSEEPKNILVEKPVNEKSEANTKWLNVYNFDKLYNLTEKDWGPQNETKLISISAEDHIKIYENEDKHSIDTQLHEGNKNIFNLLSPEGLLSYMNYEGQSNGLERTKRQAEDGEKRCRCPGNMVRRRRRRRRRNRVGQQQRPARRRRRRNRVGQQQRPARRRRRRRGRRRNQRRGRRRCVCKKTEEGEGEGKSDGEEPEVEEADGEDEGTVTEGTDENATEEAEADNEDDEEEEEEEEDDDDDDDEDEDGEDENEEEEEGDDENSPDEKGKELKSPEGMPSLGGIPAYIVPYPNMMETPNAVIPARGYPVANIPTRAVPMYKFPSHSTRGALPLRKSISNKED